MSEGAREARAFAPGRVNLIGEHTDYNRGLALPFAIAEGVTVRARAVAGRSIRVRALDLGEDDEFVLSPGGAAYAEGRGAGERAAGRDRIAGGRGEGWRAFVRGVAAELRAAGAAIPGADVEISGDVPRGAGLSSSAALEVALALALLALAGTDMDGRELARLCARVEHEWVGARTGLLDQLASICGQDGHALCIDFATLEVRPVPLVLAGGWRLVTLDSGDARALAASGYNARRAECARACELLGVDSLREAQPGDVARLPEPLARRLAHVLGENARVRACVAALAETGMLAETGIRARGPCLPASVGGPCPPASVAGDLPLVGALLDASHASLRDLYECSTPAVEATVGRLRAAGAVGARMVGGGFGGHVLGLLPPGAASPPGAREVRPSPGARVLAPR